MELPSHADVLIHFDALIDGSKTPEEVSAWACCYYQYDEIAIPDDAKHIWEALKVFCLCDAWGGERKYLYGQEDFIDWRAEFLEKSKAKSYMTPPLLIAFDGPAASGKGTLASVIAADYGLPFLDTGLIYRAVGFLRASRGLDLSNVSALAEIAANLDLETLENPGLRGREAGEWASQVAAIPEVRQALKQFQIDFAHQASGAVLDGRDIGTVIAPDAMVKIFVTADPEVRAKRRWLQLVKDMPDLAFEDILADIRLRDERDSSRASAPLVMAQDALLLDTTNLGIEAAIETARRLVTDRCGRP